MSSSTNPALPAKGFLLLLLWAMPIAGGCERGTSNGSGAYPQRPIKLVVPFSAGGGTDKFARIIERAIDENDLLPQPLVIINQKGAGATIGSRRVKDAEPDGYTLLVLHDAIITARYSGKVDYGPEAFEAVAGTGEMGMVLAVSEGSPYYNLEELMEAARREPGSLAFGANLGALTHFVGLQLERRVPGARFRFAQIGGGAERFADLKGGHIDVTGFSIEEFDRFRSEGLRGLAYFGRERHPAAPDVPTAREQGIDMLSSSMFYWWFPKGTPAAVRERMAEVLEQAMRTDYVRRRMAAIHCDPVFLRGAALRRRIDQSTREVAQAARRADEPRETTPMPPTVPATLLALAVLLVPVSLHSWRDSRRRRAERRALAAESPPRRPGLAWMTAALSLLYPAAMVWGLDFRLATFLYVLLLGLLLGWPRGEGTPARGAPAQDSDVEAPRVSTAGQLLLRAAVLLSVAGLLSVGLHLLFTRLFVIDLP